jgi:hypothetical protein
MAAAVITVNDITPALPKRAQEVQVIQRALSIAETQIRAAGGTSAAGTMTDNGVTLGTWVYTAVAAS